MTEHGGSTTQSGILYQNSVAALYLGRLIDATARPDNQRVSRVRVEAPDDVDDIVVTFSDGHRVYIQAKESLVSWGSVWEKLWQSFGNQFRDQSFQTGKDRILLHIGELREQHNHLRQLCERALSSESYDRWIERLTTAQKTLLSKIEASITPEFVGADHVLDFLKHIDVETWPLTNIERDLGFCCK